jgi:hypothetical protein
LFKRISKFTLKELLGGVAAATPPIQPQRCVLTDYFNNCNFSKAQIIRSLMMVIKPKYVGAVLL